MNKKFGLVILSLFAVLQVQAQSIQFEIENAGLTVKGNFSIASNEISYNPVAVAKSKFISVIAVNSISTGINLRDSHLMKEAYFDQKKYPFIKFISTDVRKVSDSKLQVRGDLTIKNVTKSITIEVLVTPDQNGYQFYFKLPINRRDYGVGGSSLTMDELVNVEVRVRDKK